MKIKEIKTVRELESLKKARLALIDFGAPWCAPCSLQEPIIQRIAVQYAGRISVAKVNIDERREVASTFGIHSIPTLILFRDSKEVQRFIGLQPESAISEVLGKFLE